MKLLLPVIVGLWAPIHAQASSLADRIQAVALATTPQVRDAAYVDLVRAEYPLEDWRSLSSSKRWLDALPPRRYRFIGIGGGPGPGQFLPDLPLPWHRQLFLRWRTAARISNGRRPRLCRSVGQLETTEHFAPAAVYLAWSILGARAEPWLRELSQDIRPNTRAQASWCLGRLGVTTDSKTDSWEWICHCLGRGNRGVLRILERLEQIHTAEGPAPGLRRNDWRLTNGLRWAAESGNTLAIDECLERTLSDISSAHQQDAMLHSLVPVLQLQHAYRRLGQENRHLALVLELGRSWRGGRQPIDREEEDDEDRLMQGRALVVHGVWDEARKLPADDPHYELLRRGALWELCLLAERGNESPWLARTLKQLEPRTADSRVLARLTFEAWSWRTQRPLLWEQIVSIVLTSAPLEPTLAELRKLVYPRQEELRNELRAAARSVGAEAVRRLDEAWRR